MKMNPCLHPLLPSFTARLLFALRTLIGIICCALLTLSSQTSTLFAGQLLLGVSFIIAIKVTLGATIQAASRLIHGGGIATCYCLFIITCFSQNIYIAIGSTTILVLIIVYTDLPVLTRRFTLVPSCIILLQWFSKPNADWKFVLQVWLSLTMGSFLAVFVQLIPLPSISTAYREFQIRLNHIRKQIRRELTTIILLIFEYNDKFNRHEHFVNSDQDDRGIEFQIESTSSNDYQQIFEYFNDDHLLRSDLEDLNSLVNQEIQLIQRLYNELVDEPYFILLKYLNSIRTFIRFIPSMRKCVNPPSTFEQKLSKLVLTFQSLQRIISSLILLDKHNRSLIGQRKFINSICCLLETTFNYLDFIVDTQLGLKKIKNIDELQRYRSNVEESLENFFEEYVRFRETSLKQIQDNHEETHLSTFILLLLRCVHVVMSIEQNEKQISTEKCSLKKILRQFIDHQINYIGLRPSWGKFLRSLKTSLSVLLSAILVFTYGDRLPASGWLYWAPMTTALVSDSSEGGTIRLSIQRLMAVLFGSTYAYLVILLTQNRFLVGIFISLFVAFMGYLKTDSKKEYFASVCAQSASIITFLSGQQGQINVSNEAVLARTSLTFLGVFVQVFVSNIVFPVTARSLVMKKISIMIKNVSDGLTTTIDSFCSFIDSTDEKDHKSSNINLNKILGETERLANNLPSLIEEALNEPNLWKRPFIEVKDRYQDLGKLLRSLVSDIRLIHRCTVILKAESTLHLALEARWQIRRISFVRLSSINQDEWAKSRLEEEKHLLKDLDVPLKIFTSQKRKDRMISNENENENETRENQFIFRQDSTKSFRLANLNYYQPVLQHLKNVQKQLIEVLHLIDEFIDKPVAVDVGFDGFHQFYRNESVHFQQSSFLNRDPSIFMLPETEPIQMFSSNPYRCCFCLKKQTKDQQNLPSLRSAVDRLIQYFHAFSLSNDRFIRSEFVSNQSIGDSLAFHTLSYSLTNILRSTTNIAKNARRIKYLNINARQTQQ